MRSFGGFDRLFLKGLTPDSTAATFSKGVVIPEYIYMVFQCTFAAITPCLIVGAFAERMKFSAVLMFMVLWFTFSYLPIAHMVWFWAGPDAYTDAAAADKAQAIAGFIFQKGALDFAGGTVVHINAGIAGLVGALMLGKRIGYGREAMAPHSLTMTMIGASLLWVGWFGFNAGSNLEANGTTAHGLRQHVRRDRGGRLVVDVPRMDVQRQTVDAGRGVRCGRGTGGDYSGLRLGRSDGLDRAGPHRRRRLPVVGQRPQADVRLRRCARRVRRALHRRHCRRDGRGRVRLARAWAAPAFTITWPTKSATTTWARS